MSFRTHASFLFCIIASCLVRSSLAGDSIGAQVQYDAATGAVLIDWEALPEHYYFLEQTGDLTGSFATAKLFKDLDGDGQLSTGLNTNADSAFFRFTYTDDQNDAMLRADSDGDKISNIDEADAGMDAFQHEIIADSDGDNLPDYWEEFYFGNLSSDEFSNSDGMYSLTRKNMILVKFRQVSIRKRHLSMQLLISAKLPCIGMKGC